MRVEGDAPADALAPLLTEHVVRSPPQTGPFLALECELDLPTEKIERSYVRIHIDQDENGRVTVGDQVSFQAHHLLAAAADDGLDVPLQIVAE